MRVINWPGGQKNDINQKIQTGQFELVVGPELQAVMRILMSFEFLMTPLGDQRSEIAALNFH